MAGVKRARDKDDRTWRNSSGENTQGLAGLANCEEKLLKSLKKERVMAFIF